MIEKEQLRTLIPHAGEMCLLDAVESWSDAAIHCRAQSHRSHSNPLRRDDALSVVHCIEYAAQAAAAHGALLQNKLTEPARAQPGMLAAVRDVRFHAGNLHTLSDDLHITATRRLARPDGLVYDFTIRAGEQLVAEGRVVIALGALR